MIGVAERRAAETQSAGILAQHGFDVLEALDRRFGAYDHHFVFRKNLGKRRHVFV
jgi:hypothetical protein